MRLVARFDQVVTGRVERRWIREVWGHPEVVSLKAARLLQTEPEIIDLETAGDTGWRDTDERRPAGIEVTGREVVIGLVDVGCDFAHPHFRLADGTTRLVALWDQSQAASPSTPALYGYGAVYTRDDINRALTRSQPYKTLGYNPAQADPLGVGAHGTLVLDIAAGNGRTPGSPKGIAPDADLIFVHAATGVMGRLANLGDSVRILEALDFIAQTAKGRPWVINVSMGRRGGAHDGLSLVEQGMDALLLQTPGAALVLSTGNYFSSRAHASGQLRPAQERTLIWRTDKADITPNELEIWYSGKDVVTLVVRAPGRGAVFRVLLAAECPVSVGGTVVGHIYHRARDPNNGDNQIDIFLRPEAPAGDWQVTLIGEDIVDGKFHAWVERDAPCPHCDSRFDPLDADPFCTTGTLCNGFRTIAAGAYDGHSSDRQIASFSSAGPLRDFRQKPDLVAPGVGILGARSAPEGEEQQKSWLTRMSGTSFAAPQVTGTIALMFEAASRPLSIQETRRLLLGSTRRAAPLSNEAVRLGSGYLDVERAVAAARRFGEEGLIPVFETRSPVPEWSVARLPSWPRPEITTMESTMNREDVEAREELLGAEFPLEEEPTEKAIKRFYVLVSGGPGPYDDRDVEHDQSWANYVSPPLLMTDTSEKQKKFREKNEEIWWLIYRPAYACRWKDDFGNTSTKRQKAIKEVRDQGFTSYLSLLEDRARSRGWNLLWLDDAAGFWNRLETFPKGSISRLWYWGHARDDLWLSLGHMSDAKGTAIAPESHEIIRVADIVANLRDRFQVGQPQMISRFVGCNTIAFGKAWANEFKVWTEGVKDKVGFKSIHLTGGEPCLVGSAAATVFKPGGLEDAAATIGYQTCKDLGLGESLEILGLEAKDEFQNTGFDFKEVQLEDLEQANDIAGENEDPEEINGGEFLERDGDRGARLVEVADRIISSGSFPDASAAFISRVLSEAGVEAFNDSRRPGLVSFPSPEAIWKAWQKPALKQWEYIERFLAVVVAPGGVLERKLRSGDILVRVVPGEPGLGHLALIADSRLWWREQLVEAGLTPEGRRPGLYVLVVEGGGRPHRSDEGFARCLSDINGLLSRNSLIVRRVEEDRSRVAPEMLQEQAGNVLDPSAAEPLFKGLVRLPSAPLPDVAALKAAALWNRKMHPAESGISLVELCARLEKYIDRPALDKLMRLAGAGLAVPPYGSDEATIVTLLAEQFQRKTCRIPTVGDTWKPPTMSGMVAEDTLDALGFVYHTGRTSVLNQADLVNKTAAGTLKKVQRSEFEGLEAGLTAKTWWSYMVRPPWLGMPIKQGIHLVLLKRLRQAQRFLMSLPAYENMNPAMLGQVLGLEEEHKGARPRATTRSLHTFGLGIDISYTHNPWLSNPARNTSKIAAITRRAAQFVGGKPRGQTGISARLLHQLAVEHRDTTEIHRILSGWSKWLGSYFALAAEPKHIESQLPVLNASNPDVGFILPGETVAKAARRWTRTITADFDDFATATGRGGRDKEAVRNGFMDVPRDLVLALREYACLAWGAVDFGPVESGDVMHFDCRVDGIGRAIRIATGKPAPTQGHLCIPSDGHRAAQGEFVEDAPQAPAPSLRFKFYSKVIAKYADASGSKRSTNCFVAVPSAARNKKGIDLLVFLHGLDTCDPGHDFDARKVAQIFELDTQIDAGKQAMALVVPALYWVPLNKTKTNQKEANENKGNIIKTWSAARIAAFVEEVMDRIAEKSGDRPSLRHLVLAGHSRAYDILTPLAKEFVSGVPATTRGALAKLVRVLALDTTYGTRHAEMLMKWADKLGAVKFLLVLSSHGYDPEKNDCRFRKNDPPIKYWDCAAQGVQLPANLEVKKVSAKHCRLPNDCVKIALTSASKKQDPESFDSEGSGTPGTPVLFLAKVKISGLPEIILSWGSSGHYEGFFATPIHLRDDQTGYAQSTRKTIELTGRIQIEESGVRRNYDGKKDGKDWPLGGIEGIAPVKIVKADGPIISTASISKVRRDGSFSFTTAVIVDGFTRSLTIYPKLDLKHAKIIAATVEVELLDLEGFLALVDPREKARPASQTHPEFLASVRKIYQGGPKDPLSGAFDMVLYRHRAVKPLAAPGTALDQRFKLYKDWLFADREWIDIGHVLTGIEGSPKQEPSKDQNVPIPRRPELIVTWAGDLGSALQTYIKDFWNAVDKGDPLDLDDFLRKRASRVDLIGDIDGINIGSVYDASRSLADNLRAYYGKKSRHRFHEFIATSKDENGKAELPLAAGQKPPRLSKLARQAIAENTRQFLVPFWVTGKLYRGTDPARRQLIDNIMNVASPEMDVVVDYFVDFLENGLAQEQL
ncbi:MAG: S8 family serine peptidase [Desulfobacterales bacterium]